MERYFRYEAAGDQYTGRVVAGLPINCANLAILPPHFENGDDTTVLNILKLMFPIAYQHSHLHGVLHLLLSSLVFHYDFLVDLLPSNHPLFSTTLFVDPTVRSQLNINIVSSLESSKMYPTGVPPHVELLKQIAKNGNAILALPSVIFDSIKKLMDENGVASGQITRQYFELTLQQTVAKAIEDTLGSSRRNDQTSAKDAESESINCPIPESFSFPSVDVASAWTLWWYGNPARKYPPFCKIKTIDIAAKNERKAFYEWKFLMDKMSAFYKLTTGKDLNCVSNPFAAAESFAVAKRMLEPLKHLTSRKRKRRDEQLRVATAVRLVRQLKLNGEDSSGNSFRFS
ncbi:hypothetical protein AeMF1_005711 [Aphanomyces euteiches]|nr:hypothetical protein AeMF1_005711 [Aphanomyces euteiches]